MTVIPVKIVRVTGDTVIRPHAEGAVRVQLRVGQAVTCRVCGIRDADIQIRCGGVNAGQPAGGAVAVTPGLARAADADEFAVVVPCNRGQTAGCSGAGSVTARQGYKRW